MGTDDAPRSFSAVLKTYRKKARLSQQEVAERMNVTRNTIVNWETDKSKPDYSCIPALCALLDIPVYRLFNMDPGNGLSPQEEQMIANFRLLSPMNRTVVDKMLNLLVEEEASARQMTLRESAVFMEIRPAAVAAGGGVEVTDPAPSYTFLRKNSINARADGIVLVSGDSMEPVYHDGDYVYYVCAEDARPGEDVIVDTDDGAVIKRLGKDRTLYSVNPDRPYGEKSEDNLVRIRGRVLGIVAASDYLSGEDRALAEEIFAEEIRGFARKHHMEDWE